MIAFSLEVRRQPATAARLRSCFLGVSDIKDTGIKAFFLREFAIPVGSRQGWRRRVGSTPLNDFSGVRLGEAARAEGKPCFGVRILARAFRSPRKLRFCAFVQQHIHHFFFFISTSKAFRPVQRRIAVIISGVRVRALVQKPFRNAVRAALCRPVQRGFAVAAFRVRVRAGIKQKLRYGFGFGKVQGSFAVAVFRVRVRARVKQKLGDG